MAFNSRQFSKKLREGRPRVCGSAHATRKPDSRSIPRCANRAAVNSLSALRPVRETNHFAKSTSWTEPPGLPYDRSVSACSIRRFEVWREIQINICNCPDLEPHEANFLYFIHYIPRINASFPCYPIYIYNNYRKNTSWKYYINWHVFLLNWAVWSPSISWNGSLPWNG